MATTWVDFKQLKAGIGIEQVIGHYGVRLRRITATDLRGRCPLPSHTSSRSRDSFSVNLAPNVWSCRSQSCRQARGGRPGGNILDFVALMEGCSIREAALRLQNWSGAAPERFRLQRQSRPDPELAPNPPRRFALQYVDARHPYLVTRRLTLQTVRTYGLGLYTGQLDGDEAGRQGTAAIVSTLTSRVAVISVALRDGTQPDQRMSGGIQRLMLQYAATATEEPV
jgi:hypothetical protein